MSNIRFTLIVIAAFTVLVALIGRDATRRKELRERERVALAPLCKSAYAQAKTAQDSLDLVYACGAPR